MNHEKNKCYFRDYFAFSIYGIVNVDGENGFIASDVHPADYPTTAAVIHMGEKLSTETDGRLSIKMFPNGQMGDEGASLEKRVPARLIQAENLLQVYQQAKRGYDAQFKAQKLLI